MPMRSNQSLRVSDQPRGDLLSPTRKYVPVVRKAPQRVYTGGGRFHGVYSSTSETSDTDDSLVRPRNVMRASAAAAAMMARSRSRQRSPQAAADQGPIPFPFTYAPASGGSPRPDFLRSPALLQDSIIPYEGLPPRVITG